MDMTSCIAEVWPAECYTYIHEDLDDDKTLIIDDFISIVPNQIMQSCSSQEDEQITSSVEGMSHNEL